MPSICPEAFGYTNIEAMAAKLPVIATNIAGISEIVINNETGIHVNPKNEKTIVNALNK